MASHIVKDCQKYTREAVVVVAFFYQQLGCTTANFGNNLTHSVLITAFCSNFCSKLRYKLLSKVGCAQWGLNWQLSDSFVTP